MLARKAGLHTIGDGIGHGDNGRLRPTPDEVLFAESAAPVPVQWIRDHGLTGLMGGGSVENGLWYPDWSSRWIGAVRRGPELAWMAWTAITSLLDSGDLTLADRPVLSAGRVLIDVGRFQVRREGGASGNDRRVRLTAPDSAATNLLLPGLSLRDRWQDTRDWLAAEANHCQQWLEADRPLGEALLLGPRSPYRTSSAVGHRKAGGYLDERWAITDAGKWRLAFLARQSMVAGVELKRARYLSDLSEGRKKAHLHATQDVVAELMQSEGWTPLGIEMSGMAEVIHRSVRWRADALMFDSSGPRLIWVEVLKRDVARFGVKDRHRYQGIELDMGLVAGVVGVPVRLVMARGSSLRIQDYQPRAAIEGTP